MRTITYTSAAKELFSAERLEALLDKSFQANQRWQVTGMLLYNAGTFMQTIEGPPEAIEQLFKNICRDNTHHHLIKVLDEEIEERHFGEWNMGFIDGAKLENNLVGYSHFLSSPPMAESFRRSNSDAKKLLASFHTSMRRA